MQTIKKKLLSQNPHTAYYALLVLESVVKNCGAPVHDEISTKENCEVFSQVIETTPHETVKAKMLELIQAWAYAFRTSEKYQATKDTMTILKTKGHAFPELKEADAMFTSDTAPIWRDGKCCHHCRVEFSFTQRKHHCRNCGQIFCAQCSAKACTLPKFGIEKEVRVCEPCYIALQKPVAAAAAAKRTDSDLPAEYLNSSLAQQPQVRLGSLTSGSSPLTGFVSLCRRRPARPSRSCGRMRSCSWRWHSANRKRSRRVAR